jgi:4-aminobutyrate aminotransferase-like enzyme/Ser/Thr protein kinase RdoA (MazF antagonist)
MSLGLDHSGVSPSLAAAHRSLVAPSPGFTESDAERIAHDIFGLSGDAVDLRGERDQTFLIESISGKRILKISNGLETAANLDLEAGAIKHIRSTAPGVPVADILTPSALPVTAGPEDLRATVDGSNGSHFVRLFEFIPGSVGTDSLPLPHEAVSDLGRSVAELDLSLRGFFHPAAGRALLWDVKHAPSVREVTASIGSAERRLLVESALDEFEAVAKPLWPQLRAQIVHGDPILENLRLDSACRVRGVIDFGDIVHSSLLQDVAAALASVLRKSAGDTLATARLFLDGYTSRLPLEPQERSLLRVTLCARLASIIALGAWEVQQQPQKADHFAECVEDSWRVLEYLHELGPNAVEDALGAPQGLRPTSELRGRRPQLLGEALTDLFYSSPVHAVRGEGAWLWDADGRRLLDGYNNVAIVGHCHPRVTEAIADQTRRLNTHSRYLYEPLFDLAERLVEDVAERYGLDTVMVVNSGSEANDLAWRLATTWTGASGGIVSDCAYHGMTTAVADLSPQQWPNTYRPSHVQTFAVTTPERSGRADPIAQGVRDAVASLAERGVSPAALVLECGFLSDGIVEVDGADVRRATEVAHAAGALVVADEVQMGHGRSGETLWCFERFGIRPDFVTLGKPMGNGYPVAAVLTRNDIARRFGEMTYFFSTFGGNPVAARAALAVLDVIRDERRVEHADRIGRVLREALHGLATRHPSVKEVRGFGLLAGVELHDAPDSIDSTTLTTWVADELRERAVLVGKTGPRNNVLKIRPPLVFDQTHVSLLADRLDAVLTEIEEREWR